MHYKAEPCNERERDCRDVKFYVSRRLRAKHPLPRSPFPIPFIDFFPKSCYESPDKPFYLLILINNHLHEYISTEEKTAYRMAGGFLAVYVCSDVFTDRGTGFLQF